MQEPEKKVQERQSVQVATLEWHLLSDMGSGLVFKITVLQPVAERLVCGAVDFRCTLGMVYTF